MRQRVKSTLPATAFYNRIREILEFARANIARSVNTTQVVANWLIGREIVEEEQKGQDRAAYGEELLKGLSCQLGREYGRGFSVSALQYMRAFFHAYPALLEKQHAPRVESQFEVTVTDTLNPEQSRKIFASRYKLYLPSEKELREEIRPEVRRLPSRKPGRPTGKKAKKP
jgi:hypothetical protein